MTAIIIVGLAVVFSIGYTFWVIKNYRNSTLKLMEEIRNKPTKFVPAFVPAKKKKVEPAIGCYKNDLPVSTEKIVDPYASDTSNDSCGDDFSYGSSGGDYGNSSSDGYDSGGDFGGGGSSGDW